MQNNLSDLNNHLFAQLELLGSGELSNEELECVERAVHGIMNLHGLRFDSAPLMETGLAIARLKLKASEISKEVKKCRK